MLGKDIQWKVKFFVKRTEVNIFLSFGHIENLFGYARTCFCYPTPDSRWGVAKEHGVLEMVEYRVKTGVVSDAGFVHICRKTENACKSPFF